MAPSSPSPAAPTRVSGRKRAAKAEEIHQSQEEEEEVVAASSAKRSRKAASSGKKPKPTPKQAKAGRKKKGEAERKEPVEDETAVRIMSQAKLETHDQPFHHLEALPLKLRLDSQINPILMLLLN
jgi:DNA (cytosine-5)-methyltransferase 1